MARETRTFVNELGNEITVVALKSRDRVAIVMKSKSSTASNIITHREAVELHGALGGLLGIGRPSEPLPQPLHRYKPNKKYPWFCAHCGYAEHERLMHEPTPLAESCA